MAASLSYRELRKLLEEAGCILVRQAKGSHEIWRSPHNPKPFPVPTTLKAEGTLRAIPKAAGIRHPKDR